MNKHKNRPEPKAITNRYLERVAMNYLSRYASSTDSLRKVLMRRVDRAVAAGKSEYDESQKLVEELLQKLSAAKILDDELYAAAYLKSLRRKGGSERFIRQKMQEKGVERALIDKALGNEMADIQDIAGGKSDIEDTREQANILAALIYARRRRLGPYRTKQVPEDEAFARREKDMASLARRGFALNICHRIVKSKTIEEAEALARR